MYYRSKCTIAERYFKEARHKLTVERGIIYNANAIVPPPNFKEGHKSVHDDIHGGVAATQRRLTLQAW